ncbi:MAG: hypothetical protein ACRDPD_14500, partial [Streptosporangiaceae bacterium]
RRGDPGIGRAAVATELLPARIEVARHATDPMAWPGLPGLVARVARPRRWWRGPRLTIYYAE